MRREPPVLLVFTPQMNRAGLVSVPGTRSLHTSLWFRPNLTDDLRFIRGYLDCRVVREVHVPVRHWAGRHITGSAVVHYFWWRRRLLPSPLSAGVTTTEAHPSTKTLVDSCPLGDLATPTVRDRSGSVLRPVDRNPHLIDLELTGTLPCKREE